MKRPTDRQLARYWESFPDDELYTCTDCGKVDRKYRVQPQHPYYANGETGVFLCPECIAERNAQRCRGRKAGLEGDPTCSVPDCDRRGTWYVGRCKALLCGWHKNKAIDTCAAHVDDQLGGLALLASISFTERDIVSMAQGKSPSKVTINWR